MSGSSDPELLPAPRRLSSWTLERDSSEDVDEFEWGRLIYNPRTADIWSGQLPRGSTPARFDADRLVALADEAAGWAGTEASLRDPARSTACRAARATLQGARLGYRSQSLHGAAPTARSGGLIRSRGRLARRSRRFDGRSRSTTRTSPATPSSSGSLRDARLDRDRQRPLVRGARGWGAGRLLRALRARWGRPGGDRGDKARGSRAVVWPAPWCSRPPTRRVGPGTSSPSSSRTRTTGPGSCTSASASTRSERRPHFLRKPPQLSGESP